MLTRGRGAGAIVVLGLLLAGGCTQEKADPVGGPAASVNGLSSQAQAGRWSGLAGECPALTGSAAQALNRTGQGNNSDTRQMQGAFYRNCHWSTPARERPIVDVSVQICVTAGCVGGPVTDELTKVRDKAQAEDRTAGPNVGTVYEKIAVPGLDDAFMVSSTAGPVLYMRGTTFNALIGVWLHLPTSVVVDLVKRQSDYELVARELLDKHQATVLALVADVLDDLR